MAALSLSESCTRNKLDSEGSDTCESKDEVKNVAEHEEVQCNQKVDSIPSDKGLPRMTPDMLRECCLHSRGFSAPELNDVLMLQYKGFRKIEGLDAYKNVKSLFLECNGINKIENLDVMPGLVSLYLQSNCIKCIENLDSMTTLKYLNLSNNSISCIENLAPLQSLETIKVATNKIVNVDALQGLAQCPTLVDVDIAYNYIEDGDGIIDFWAKNLPEIECLYLHHNSCSRGLKDFRRRLISSLKRLRWLDERPVTELERVGCEAWAWGGKDAELKAKQAHYQREHQAKEKSFYDHRRIQEAAKERARAQREAQAQRDTARAQAATDLENTGTLGEGWLSVDSGPTLPSLTNKKDSMRHAELHAKVKAFLIGEQNHLNSTHSDDHVVDTGESFAVGISADVKPCETVGTQSKETSKFEKGAGITEDGNNVLTHTSQIFKSQVEPIQFFDQTRTSNIVPLHGIDVVNEEKECEQMPIPAEIPMVPFEWTAFRDKRLGRLVAEYRYDFSKAATALSEEFNSGVGVEECRQRYRELCRPSPKCRSDSSSGTAKQRLDEEKGRAKDAPPVSSATVKEVSEWWLQKMSRQRISEQDAKCRVGPPACISGDTKQKKESMSEQCTEKSSWAERESDAIGVKNDISECSTGFSHAPGISMHPKQATAISFNPPPRQNLGRVVTGTELSELD